MKKFMMGMTVLSVMVFGANVQLKTPQMKVVTPVSKDSVVLSPKVLKGAKVNNYKVGEPAQFTLEVPIDIDAVNMNTYTNIRRGRILCGIVAPGFESRLQHKDIDINHDNKKTIVLKFNGIPKNEALKIDACSCMLLFVGADGKELLPGEVFPNGVLAPESHTQPDTDIHF